MKFSKDSLKIDASTVTDQLVFAISNQVRKKLRKNGVVIGISGGIDSSVVAALSVRALGKDAVMGVIMPEKESAGESQNLAEHLAGHLGIEYVTQNISPVLDGFNCYRLRNEAIKRVFPDFTDDHKAKITIASNPLEKETLNFFKLTIESPEGRQESKRMSPRDYLQIVAASNFKQRTRMAILYYHAEKLNRAVVGTGNKDEHELGFFVKYGDGGTDLKPIAHLYKMQVYQLARFLEIPDRIVKRTPTTDTYSAEVTQTEFFFGLDFELLDLIWWGMEHEIPARDMAAELNLTVEQIERVCRDIRQKQRTTEYLRSQPLEFNSAG